MGGEREREREREKLTSPIGADEEASVARVNGEGEVLDERGGTRRWMAVYTWVGEFEAVDRHHGCRGVRH